jgi:hypothetical protein
VPPPSRARTHPNHPAEEEPLYGQQSNPRPHQAQLGPGRQQLPPGPAAAHRRPQPTTHDLEQAFDRLNPDYGVPADTHNPSGRQALRDREAALALGTRVAVAASRENDPNPVMWLAGQDYRAADATRTARLQTVRQRHGPEWVGPER